MGLTIRPLDQSNHFYLNTCNSSFKVDARLQLRAEAGYISYTVEPLPGYIKRYPQESIDYTAYIDSPDKAIFLAYLDDEVAGQVIIKKNWNNFAYIEDLVVDALHRRQGIGRRLMEKAIQWARDTGLPGVTLETQNNNLAACRLYESCGFHLGGFDNDLYGAIEPYQEEIAMYWYLYFD